MIVKFSRPFSGRQIHVLYSLCLGLSLTAICLGLLRPPQPVLAWPDELVATQATIETDNTYSLDWGDWDNDGDEDLAVGNNGEPNRVYENVTGKLILAWSAPIFESTFSVAWGHFNNDGYLDLAVASGAAPVRVYTNTVDQNGNRILVPAWVQTGTGTGDWAESVAWADWDNDGDNDLAIGSSLGSPNRVYTNTGNGLQLAFTTTETNGTKSIAWGDWNNDGYPDLAVGNYFEQPNQIYTNTTDNNGNRILALAWQSDEQEPTSSVAWGDWNNDGFLDLAVGNSAPNSSWSSQPNRVYVNTDIGNGNRTMSLGWTSPEVDDTYSVDWGDWDGDGDLDLAVGNVNWPSLQPMNRIYANNPVSGSQRSLDLIWSSPEVDDTQSVAWSDIDNDGDLDLAAGNQHQPNRIYLNGGGHMTLVWVSTNADDSQSLAWGDWDGDGDLDLAVANRWAPTQIYMNTPNADGSQILTLAWSSTEIEYNSDVAWGDWDNDGDLDLAVANQQPVFGPNPICFPTRVYENVIDETGNRTLLSAWTSPPIPTQSCDFHHASSLAWGDWDNDGDQDLAVGNINQFDRVYENTGETLEYDATNGIGWQADQPLWTLDIDWGDWDNDGDLDLALARGNNQPTTIYTNGVDLNGNRTLTIAWESPAPNYSSLSLDWGDWDNDGDLDLAVGNANPAPNQVFRNDGNNSMTLAYTSSEIEATSSVEWGDWDGDGDLDLAVGNTTWPNRVYANYSGTLHLAWTSSEAENSAAVAWGDWDNDGDLDLAAANASNLPNRIYENTSSGLGVAWSSAEQLSTAAVAWGDVDGDNDLDLAVGVAWENWPPQVRANQLYLNQDGDLVLAWTSAELEATTSQAWGDIDGDGDLDLATGNGCKPTAPYICYNNRLYHNDGGVLSSQGVLISTTPEDTRSVAWGDWDGDGDLDLAVGNGQGVNPPVPNRIYANKNGLLALVWNAPVIDTTNSVAWGDWDNDGDLDLAVGNDGSPNHVYQNIGGDLVLAWSSAEADATTSVAWGDWNGDGFLDLAVGNKSFQSNRVYLNDGYSLTLGWSSSEVDNTEGIGWVDWDGNGRLDLAVSNRDGRNRIYANSGDDLVLAWSSSETDRSLDIAWGDWDGDGDFDAAIGNTSNLHKQADRIYVNRLADGLDMVGTTKAIINYPGGDAANFFFSGVVLDGPVLPLTYTLYDQEGDAARLVQAHYSLDGGSQWQPAAAATGTITSNLAASPTGTTHVYYWDMFASGLLGASDNTVFRLDVYQGYSGTVPLPYVVRSAQTPPFRVRGTQVRVMSNTLLVGEAIVYRQVAGSSEEMMPYVDGRERPFLTNPTGYLQGYGELGPGDGLVALLPITSTQNYTIYHTSAAPIATGLDLYTVNSPGVQTLTVSADNTLILFNLLVSLEWDARQDTAFMEQLQNDLQRTSEILYDLTNGQAALGNVHIYHDKGYWGHANVVIRASNRQRPSAILGGIVLTPTADMGVTGPITAAYIPGQIAMPPAWNRFGNPGGTLGEDWPRTLAHELGHYLFFLPDNYLGLDENGRLTLVDCVGSAMTDPYQESYSEFLTPPDWVGECEDTLAESYLDRADWETIKTFWPMLNSTHTLTGPNRLPLGVTQIQSFAPPTPTTTLPDPFFGLQDSNGNTIAIPAGRGEAFLIQTQANSDPTDDRVMGLGSPVGNLVQARGAAPGDRLCVFDYGHTPLRLGCLNSIGNNPAPITLHEVADWQPQMRVTPINTTTVMITVTNVVSESGLMVQLIPAAGEATLPVSMTETAVGFTQILTAPQGAYFGHVRYWVPGGSPLKESIAAFVAVEDWGGQSYAWGGQSYAWGNPAFAWGGQSYAWGGQSYAWGGQSYAWGAPAMSGDGQVSVFPLENLFGSNRNFTLQTLPLPPTLPSWLAPVGYAYRFEVDGDVPDSDILFRYLAENVPAGHEPGLRVYYSPDEGASWQRLETVLDTYRNHASAQVQGTGIYLLIATIEGLPLQQHWNLFAYPNVPAQSVEQALASIEDAYTAVYEWQAGANPSWRLYDQTVRPPFGPLVNDLPALEPLHTYWIYALTDTIPYIGTGDLNSRSPIGLPPATFYGWVTPTAAFTPTPGMPVTAEIGGVACGSGWVTDTVGNDQLAYKLYLRADDGDGCGAPGRQVVFKIDGQVMAETYQLNEDAAWNQQAWLHSLEVVNNSIYSVYLPIVVQQ